MGVEERLIGMLTIALYRYSAIVNSVSEHTFWGKGTQIFPTDKTGGCRILGIAPNIRCKLGFFNAKLTRKLADNSQNLGFR